MKIRNVGTPEGHDLGRHLARFCDEAEPQARLIEPTIPPRCASCAFREGKHTASGSPSTQMDALKCWLEGREFQCHEPGRRDQPCSGWVMMTLVRKGRPTNCPWPFSDEL